MELSITTQISDILVRFQKQNILNIKAVVVLSYRMK